MQPKIVLIQARNPKDVMARHELKCFAQKLELDESQIKVRNLLQAPVKFEDLKDSQAVFLGGSGNYYASKGDLPGFESYLDVLRELCEASHPTLGVCYGFHCLARAQGAQLIQDAERTEVGTYTMRLTEHAKNDPLLGALPQSFNAQMGHKDHVITPPENCLNLVESDLSANQAFRVGQKPIWAVQFHPELDMGTNKDRFLHYLEGYAGNMSDAQREEQLSAFRPSPEASTVLKAFLDLVLE
jgi:GMP synthase (glutamine-hydrolysing)